MSSAPCRSIWEACKRGDHAYVDEYIKQQPSKEEQQPSTATARSKRGGGGRGGGASASQAASAASSYTQAASSSTAVLVDDGLGLLSADGSSLLHAAALFQRRRVVRMLTAQGGMDPATRDRESGWSPMHHALYRGDFLTAAVLMQGAPSVAAAGATHADADGHTAFDLVGAHVREASAARRARSNGSGRTAATDASGQPVRFVRESALTAQSSAFAALSVSAAADSSPAPFNLLYSFGYQSHWTLGFAVDHYQHKARLVDALSHSSVAQVVALKQALFVLDEHGAVYSNGQGQSGKLGHESRETLIQPKRIAALQSSVVTFIAGTDEFMLAVNNKGQVHAWGQCAFLDGAAATASSNKGAKLQSGTSSPPPNSRSLDSSAAASAAAASSSTAAATAASKFSQLPRRLECLRGHSVSRIWPSSTRLVFQTTDDAAADDDDLAASPASSASQLWFVGQSIEDADRWESAPKRLALSLPAAESTIRSVFNHDDFIALLTSAGSIRMQRKGERKLNKIWLQNYRADAPTQASREAGKSKSIRDLFPLIPNAHVVRMAFSADGKRGAAVSFSGQLFLWKLAAPENKNAMASPSFGASGSMAGAAIPSLSLFASAASSSASTAAPAPARSPAPSYPRTIGYLVEGLAHVRVTDVSVTSGHTTVLTEDGHVYSFGPTCIGHVHPSVAAASAQQPVLRPKRLLHLNQVKRVVACDQYLMLIVSIARPPVLPSFPEMRGVFEVERKLKLAAVALPSLRMLCEHHLAGQITPLSVVSAYQWAAQTASPHLLHFCTHFLLLNLPFYLPALLALPDIECLQSLQHEYAATYPMWWTSPQHSQPFQSLDALDAHASMLTNPEADAAVAAESAGESFSFSHALAQLKAAAVQAALPKTTEERVGEIKLKRRALRKKLVQIEALEAQMHARKIKLDPDQHDKIKQKQTHVDQVAALDSELRTLRDNGSVSAAKLWDRLHGLVGAEDDDAENVPAAASSVAAASTPAPAVLADAPVAEHEPLAPSPSQPQSRVAAELIDRPVRALVKAKAVEPTPKKNQKAVSTSATKPTTSALPPSGPTASSASASAAASWKPAVVAAPAVAVVREPAVRAAAPPATSFAAIQAEEACAAAAAAAAQRSARSTPNKPAASSSSIVAAVGVGGGKGWGVSPAAASTSPSLRSVAAPSSNFPSLGSAAVSTPTKAAASSAAFGSPALKSSPSIKSPLVASVASPSTRALVGGSSAPMSTFSLADFMPALPAQPAKPATPLKTWNVPGAVAVLEPTPAQRAAASVAASGSADKRKGGKKANAASSVTAPAPAAPAAPLSLLEIQRAEELRHYGSASASKRDRELDELEAASAPRCAWNGTHMVSSTALQAQPTLAELQGEQLSAILAEEERIKRNAEKKERQKELKIQQKAAAAALAAAKAASLASAAASAASAPPATASSCGSASRPSSAAPRGGGHGGGRGGRGGSRPVTAAAAPLPVDTAASTEGKQQASTAASTRGRGGPRPPSAASAAVVPPAARLVCVETNPGPCNDCGRYPSDAHSSNAQPCVCVRSVVPAATEAASSISLTAASVAAATNQSFSASSPSSEQAEQSASDPFRPCEAAECENPSRAVCPNCMKAAYCSQSCYRKVYAEHKPICRSIKAAKCTQVGCSETRISSAGQCARHAADDVPIDIRTSLGYGCFLHDWSTSAHVSMLVHAGVRAGLLPPSLRNLSFLLCGKMYSSLAAATADEGPGAFHAAFRSKIQSSAFLYNVLLVTGSRQLIDLEDAEVGPALMEMRDLIRLKLLQSGRLSCTRCHPARVFACESYLALHCVREHPPSSVVCAACRVSKAFDQFSAAQRSILLGAPRRCNKCESLRRGVMVPALPQATRYSSDAHRDECRFSQDHIRWNGVPSLMDPGAVLPCLGPDHHRAAAGLSVGAPWRCARCELCSVCQWPVSRHRAPGVQSHRAQLGALLEVPVQAVTHELQGRFSASAQARLLSEFYSIEFALLSEFTIDAPLRVHASSRDGVVTACYSHRGLLLTPVLYALKFPVEVKGGVATEEEKRASLKEAMLLFFLRRKLRLPHLSALHTLVYDPTRKLYGFAATYLPPHVSIKELCTYQEMYRNKCMHSVATTMHIVTQIAVTLAAMHEAGVAHLDLHWGNVLLTLRHELCIIDLGRADLFVQVDGSSQQVQYVERDRRQWRWLVERLHGREMRDNDFWLDYPPCLEAMLVTNERDFDFLTLQQIVDQLAACQCPAHLRPVPALTEDCPECAEVAADPPPSSPRGSSSS